MIDKQPVLLDISPTRKPFKDQFQAAGYDMDHPGGIDLADTRLMLFSALNALEGVLKGLEQ